MKYGGLDQAERRHGRAFPVARQSEQRREVALDAQLRFFERSRRLYAILGEHGETDLRVENRLRQALERQQADGLLLQLFDALDCRARWRAQRSGSPSGGWGRGTASGAEKAPVR